METLVYKSSFHVWEKFIGIGSAQALFSPDSLPKGSFSHFLHLFSLHLSLSQNVGDRESRGVASSLWAFTSIFHMHYETQLIKLQVFAMTRPPSICNKYLFIPSIFSYSVCVSCLLVGAADWMNQILCLF